MGTEDEVIKQKLEELKNFKLKDQGMLYASDMRDVFAKHAEVTYALFERQHTDVLTLHESVKQFTKSSKRVEKLTWTLIGLTAVLAIMTALLIK